jgi:hypothetical protein
MPALCNHAGIFPNPAFAIRPPDSQIRGCCLVQKVCKHPCGLDRTSCSALHIPQLSFEAVISPWHCCRSIVTARVSAAQSMLRSEERASGATGKIDGAYRNRLVYEPGDRLRGGGRRSAELHYHPPAAPPSRNKQPKQPPRTEGLPPSCCPRSLDMFVNALYQPRD